MEFCLNFEDGSGYSFVSLFAEVIEEIRRNYPIYRFVMERDIVWEVQKLLAGKIKQQGLPYNVFNDYPIEKGRNRSLSVDLAVISKDITCHRDIADGKAEAELVVEFKFEPSHKREDIISHKLPVISSRKNKEEISINIDINRIKSFVDTGKSRTAIAILIDEGGWHRNSKNSHRLGDPCISKWYDWDVCITDFDKVSILLTTYTIP